VLDGTAVDKALRDIISDLDSDLHKSLESDEETGEDSYDYWVERFITVYNSTAE